jgi:hypothetical protein
LPLIGQQLTGEIFYSFQSATYMEAGWLLTSNKHKLARFQFYVHNSMTTTEMIHVLQT